MVPNSKEASLMCGILIPSNKDLLGIGFYAVLIYSFFLSNGTYTVPVDCLITLLYSSTTQRVAAGPVLYTVGL